MSSSISIQQLWAFVACQSFHMFNIELDINYFVYKSRPRTNIGKTKTNTNTGTNSNTETNTIFENGTNSNEVWNLDISTAQGTMLQSVIVVPQ